MDVGSLPPSQESAFYSKGLPSGLSNLFEAYLGPPIRPQAVNPYEKRSVATFNGPEAFVGRNLFLRDTVTDWMLTAQYDWPTRRVFPIVYTTEIHIMWQQWETNAHFLGVTPHQGTSKIVSQKRNLRRAQLIRRGIMLEFEEGFTKTELGQECFVRGLYQIVRAIQETLNIEVINALVNAHRYQRQFMRETAKGREQDLVQQLEEDRDRFAIANKNQLGLELLSAQVYDDMRTYRGDYDCLIMNQEVVISQKFVGEKRTDYYRAGAIGPARVNGDGTGIVAAGGTNETLRGLEPEYMVRGKPVYIARAYATDTVGKQNMLERTRAVGEYNTMIDECPANVPYQSLTRDICIYDESHDEFDEVTLDVALDECNVFDQNGDVSQEFVRNKTRGSDALNTTVGGYDPRRNFLAAHISGQQTISPVKYVGDVDQVFYGVEHIEAAGMSVARAIYRSDDQQLAEQERILAGIRRKAAAGTPGYDTYFAFASGFPAGGGNPAVPAAGTPEERSAFDYFAARLIQLLDSATHRNAFFASALATPSTVYANVMVQGVVPIQRDVQPGQNFADVNARLEAENQRLLNALLAPIPEDEKPRIQAIFAQENMPVEQRANQVHAAMKQMLKEGTPQFAIKNEEGVDRFFQARLQGWQAKQAEIRASATTTAAASGEEERSWAPPGQQLPEGWSYVHAASATAPAPKKSSGAGFIPSSLQEVSSMLNAHHAELSAAQAAAGQRSGPVGRHAGGASGTFASIGRLDFEGDSSFAAMDARSRSGADRAFSRFAVLNGHIARLSQRSSGFMAQVCGMFYLGARFNKTVFKQFRDNNIRVPMNFLLLRPQATYRTRSVVFCKEGGGAGNVFYGSADMRMGFDAMRKVGIAHYTAYMAAVVTNPRNVFVQHDVQLAGYEGGLDLRFWTPQSYREFTRNAAVRPPASIICVAVPYAERDFPLVFDISGNWNTEMRSGVIDQSAERAYSTADVYNSMFGLYDPLRRPTPLHMLDARSTAKHINTEVWRGAQYNRSHVTARYDKWRPNHGHHGPAVYNGIGQVRKGKFVAIEPERVAAECGR